MSRHLISLTLLAAASAAPAQEKITWQDHIRPIFENRCNNCHNADKKKGDLDLSTFAGVIAGGSGGASVEAGDSAGSTLWKVISHTDEPVMPPKGDKLPQTEIDLIAKWIMGGLLDTPDGTARVKKKASFAMAAPSSSAKPEGPPPMPEHLLLEPVVTPARPNVVTAIAQSPWAPLAALAAPRQVLLYHTGTGELLGVLPFPDGGSPETLSFSRNGALLLAGGGIAGKEGTVVVWEVKTGQPVLNFVEKEDFDTVLAADISADLSRVALAGPGRRVRIYDTRTSQLIANIKKHTDWVTSLAFSPDGVLLATGDRNGGLYVWESGTGNEYLNLRAHEKRIAALAWRGDSNLLAAGSEDGNMTWWEMANGTQVKKIASHGGVLALGFAPDGSLVSGGRDGHVRIWDGAGASKRDWVTADGSPVLKAVFSEDGSRVLTGSWNGQVKIQEAAKDGPGLLLPGNPPSIDARLAALESEAKALAAAPEQAASALTEKEKAIAALETERAGLQASLAALTERRKEAAAQVERIQAGVAKMEEGKKGFVSSLEAARKELAAAVGAVPAASAPGAVPAEVKAALEQAAAAEVSLANLTRAVLEKKTAALEQAVGGCDTVLVQRRAEAAAAASEAAALQTELAALTLKMPEKDKALAALKLETETARQAVDKAKEQLAANTRQLARWKAARHQKTALVLRAEARSLKEKWDSAKEELAPLEAAVTTAPAGPPAARREELRRILTTLPAEAEAKQQAAAAAWQEYLDMLPK